MKNEMGDKRSDAGREKDAKRGNEQTAVRHLAREILMNDPFMTQLEAVTKAREILRAQGKI